MSIYIYIRRIERKFALHSAKVKKKTQQIPGIAREIFFCYVIFNLDCLHIDDQLEYIKLVKLFTVFVFFLEIFSISKHNKIDIFTLSFHFHFF